MHREQQIYLLSNINITSGTESLIVMQLKSNLMSIFKKNFLCIYIQLWLSRISTIRSAPLTAEL